MIIPAETFRAARKVRTEPLSTRMSLKLMQDMLEHSCTEMTRMKHDQVSGCVLPIVVLGTMERQPCHIARQVIRLPEPAIVHE